MEYMRIRSCPDILCFCAVLVSLFLVSCAGQEKLMKAKEEPRLENLVEVQHAAPPAKPIERLREGEQLPAMQDLTLAQTELVPKLLSEKGPRFSLAAEGVDVKSILFVLSKEIDQNIVIDPTITEKITLNLNQVTLKEMLDNVLLPLNLRYEINDGFIQVIQRELQTRVFHLNYLVSRRQGSGSLQVSTSSQIISAEVTDLWEEISNGLRKMVSVERPDAILPNPQSIPEDSPGPKNGKGWYSINKQAGVIIVKAYPEVLLQVAEFLEEVEGSVQRQVFIQARIVKVTRQEDFPTGIDWNERVRLDRAGFKDSAPANGGNSQSQAVVFGKEGAPLDEMLEALSYLGDVNVIASPGITALNNQRAVIQVGTEDVFFVHDATPTKAGYTSRPVSLGVVLDVVPQINVNGNVMMSVHTRVSKKTGERVSPDGMSRVPIVDVRQSNNTVLARSGQTVVIGGLMGSEKKRQEKPAISLAQVPFIGGLFEEDEATYEKSELVIFLTPEIMVGDAIDDRRRLEEQRLKRIVSPGSTYKMKTTFEGN